jgi:hypothetical protein
MVEIEDGKMENDNNMLLHSWAYLDPSFFILDAVVFASHLVARGRRFQKTDGYTWNHRPLHRFNHELVLFRYRASAVDAEGMPR